MPKTTYAELAAFASTRAARGATVSRTKAVATSRASGRGQDRTPTRVIGFIHTAGFVGITGLILFGPALSSARAVDLGCCLKFSGVFNYAILGWSDGRKRDAYLVSPEIDKSAFRLDGKFELNPVWTAGFTLKFEVAPAAASAAVDQLNRKGDPFEIVRDRSLVFIEHKALGRVTVGKDQSPSRGIDNINLAESDAVADAEVNDWMGSFFLRDRGGGLSPLRWDDFLFGKLAGEKIELVSYTTPSYTGFQASAAYGHSLEKDLEYRDAALRYSGQFGKAIQVKAGIGVFNRQITEPGKPEELPGWGGSLALLHKPTGLNIAFNYGTQWHRESCDDAGVVSGKCRGQDHFWYATGGIVREFNSLGPTSVYGEYYRGTMRANESDDEKLRDLELNTGQAEELKKSAASVWGVGVVQKIEGKVMREYLGYPFATELYIGYRHYALKVDLLNTAGPVPARPIAGFDAIMAGARVSF